jgi:hypothetical protein
VAQVIDIAGVCGMAPDTLMLMQLSIMKFIPQ